MLAVRAPCMRNCSWSVTAHVQLFSQTGCGSKSNILPPAARASTLPSLLVQDAAEAEVAAAVAADRAWHGAPLWTRPPGEMRGPGFPE